MRRNIYIARRKNEQGVVITLVAVFMLGVVVAMAALAIDVTTIYTARSEAQLAADSAALAGARVLANSGMTSTSDPTVGNSAATLATTVAFQVAANNPVGGRNLNAAGVCPGGEICVTVNQSPFSNPRVSVRVQRTDLPTFFARVFGTSQITVAASAIAEAYNPSGLTVPVTTMCVKPWLLPNIDPSNTTTPGSPIFDPKTGAIQTTTLLGSTSASTGTPLQPACVDCSVTPLPKPAATGWQFYPGDPASTFAAPTHALPSCTPAVTTPYELAVAACVPVPISCNVAGAVIDISPYPTRNQETSRAVNCLAHSRTSKGDQVSVAGGPSPPFQFVAGDDNPIPGLAGSNVMVSDSLVTVPVFDVGPGPPPFSPPNSTVQIVGFVQLFLSPDGAATRGSGPTAGQVSTQVVNLAGCGTNNTSVQPIQGNGASPITVRLITGP